MIAPGMMPAIEVPSFGAIVLDVLRGLGAAGARHVLDHDGRLAGDVAAEMARHRARVDVVAAARSAADDHLDGLAGVVVGGGKRGAGQRSAGRDQVAASAEARSRWSSMAILPVATVLRQG